MITVIQRVLEASVKVDGETISSINNGLLVLAGLEKGDTASDVDYTVKKLIELRIFEDSMGKMNLSVKNTNGEILAVSQFTLLGNVHKGRRPGFDNAMPPQEALEMFNSFVSKIKDEINIVKTGLFGADMKVSLINDGPVTFVIDSGKRI